MDRIINANIRAYLYDSSGADESVELDDIEVSEIDASKLLWVTVLQRDAKLIKRVADRLHLEHVPIRTIIDGPSHPTHARFDDFFHFSINSVMMHTDNSPLKYPIDFLVGKNFVVTIHDDEVDYFVSLRNREKGETMFGELSSESFVATLLDLHVVSYFNALAAIERQVDKLDSRVLKKDLETDEFITQMVTLRRGVSKLRRWLIPHRELIYSFLRADFQQIAEADTRELYKTLEAHFESAVDAIDGSRDAVLGAFDLYATKSSQLTNIFIQRLTFLTLVIGALGVVAGILGTNFKVDFFDSPHGFWITIGGMIVFTIVATLYARRRRWI